MNNRTEKEIQRILQIYGNHLYRSAFCLLSNADDAQDVLQEALIRYMEKSPNFRDGEHEKAWLMRITINLCKDFLRFRKRHTYVNLSELTDLCALPEQQEILREILTLPVKYKSMLLLHCVEGYSLKETAAILHITENAAKKRLQRGKEALRQKLKDNTEVSI